MRLREGDAVKCSLKPGPGGCPRCNNPAGRVTEVEGKKFLVCTCGSTYARVPENVIRVSVTSDVDGFGKRAFTVDWHEENGLVRGQCFRAKLPEHLSAWKKRPGYRVHVSYAPGVDP